MERNTTDFKYFLTIDVESTCWKDNDPPEGETSEIIEIGLSEIDRRTDKIYSTKSILVKPQFSTVSDFCTKLTGHTQESLKNEILYPDAADILKRHFYIKNRSWGSWGFYDSKMFRKMSQLCKCEDISAYTKHTNIKMLFAKEMGLRNPVSVEKALIYLGWNFEGTPHRGADDAYNISRILLYLIERNPDLKNQL